MADPLRPATEWNEAQHKSFEELKAEANAQKAKRENLQPMALGKGQYANIFKVGDRLRPELALRMSDKRADEMGSGQVELNDLIPSAAFRDIEHALAQANVTAQAETQEGVREEITYDRDEAEVMSWQESDEHRLAISPPAVERVGADAESAAYAGDAGDEHAAQEGQ